MSKPTLIFKKIRWKNFLSTGNSFTEIDLTNAPTTLIVGENGAGKSTFLDAICFGLYGRPYRKIKKDQLINSINKKDMVVEIEFTVYNDHYKVIRGLRPHIFDIYMNGNLIPYVAATKDHQDHLENSIMKMNLRSFSQIVILGLANFVPFMQLSAGMRREVIEDLLDIRIFTSMNMILKDKLAAVKNDISKIENEISFVNRNINLANDEITKAQKLLLESSSQFDDNISAINFEIENLRSKINEATSSILKFQKDREILCHGTTLKDLKKKEMDQALAIQKLSDRISESTKMYEFFSERETCPTCTQSISLETKDEKIIEYDRLIQESEELKKKISGKKDNVTEKIRQIQLLDVKIANAQGEVFKIDVLINAQKDALKREYEALKSSLEDGLISSFLSTKEEAVQTLKNDLAKLRSSLEELTNKKTMYDVAASLLKDGGVKAMIIKQYVPTINSLVNKYLASMDTFIKFELNETFEERVMSRHRDEFTYESFSEGEKQKLDLALLFTWREIARKKNSVSTNLLIMDEIFDSSLDSNGVEYVMNVIDSFDDGSNVFVISHKGDILADKFRSTIKFGKKNNFSRIL